MIQKILHTIFSKLLSSGLGFITIILISQYLGAEGKGEQALFIFNIVVIMLIATLIGNSTLIYLTPRHKFSELFFPSLSWIMLSISIFIIISSLTSVIRIAFPLELCIVGLLAAINEINIFILIGKEEIKKANNLKLSWQVISLALILILIALNKFENIYLYVLSIICGYFASVIYGFILLKNEYLSLRLLSKKKFFEMFKLLLRLGATKQLGSIAQSLNSRLPFYLISFYCGNSALGVFSNGVSVSEAVMMMGVSLSLVQYSRLVNINNEEYSKKLSVTMTKLNLIFTFLALTFFALLPPSFYVFVFGQEFGGVSDIIRLLFLGILLLSLSSTFSQHFSSKGNFTIVASASLIGLLATAGFGFWLIPIYGIQGAAITMVISYCATSLIEYYYFCKWTRSRFSDFIIKKTDLLELKSYLKNIR